MRFRLFRAAGIAVVFLGLALWVATTFKLRPRALIALDIPVSLSAGHIETGDFSVEPDRRYYVDIDLEKTRLSRHGCQPATVLATRWEQARAITLITGRALGKTLVLPSLFFALMKDGTLSMRRSYRVLTVSTQRIRG